MASLCDDDCIEIFTKCNVKVVKHNTIIIEGKRTDNELWSIPLTSQKRATTITKKDYVANGIIRLDKNNYFTI